MADNLLTLDLRGMTEKLTAITEQVQEKLEVAAKKLSIQAHAHVAEQAATKLHSRLELFKDNLSWKELEPGVYAITVAGEARWIEDGMSQHEMLEDLLSSPKAKISKSGKRYIVIPFKHSKGPTSQTHIEKKMLQAIKTELQKRNIPYMKNEVNPDGSPKIGLLHSFDMEKPGIQGGPVRPGQFGPQGKSFAPNARPGSQEGPSDRPYLFGVRIYQKMVDEGQVQRGIFTFRVASESQMGSGKWMHPGLAPMHFLEETFEWCKTTWDTEIAPELLQGLK